MNKGNKYSCYYIDGGGSKKYIGEYEVIEQGKVKFKMQKINGNSHWIDKDGFITINYEKSSSRMKDGEIQYKANKNGIDNGDELEFIVYCNRQGIPFIFTKI